MTVSRTGATGRVRSSGKILYGSTLHGKLLHDAIVCFVRARTFLLREDKDLADMF